MKRTTIREICEYYGQNYDNVKHMKEFIKNLKNRYNLKDDIVEEMWIILGNLEDFLEYDETIEGKTLGEFINKLQKCEIKITKKTLIK